MFAKLRHVLFGNFGKVFTTTKSFKPANGSDFSGNGFDRPTARKLAPFMKNAVIDEITDLIDQIAVIPNISWDLILYFVQGV